VFVGDAPISTTTSPINLAHLADDHPDDHLALISRNLPTTYGELRNQTARLRGGLTGLGIAPGDRVAVLCGNTRQFVVSYLAVVGIGAIAVPLNPTSPAPELERELAAVEPIALIADHHPLGTWTHVNRSATSSVHHVIAAEPGVPGRNGSGGVAVDAVRLDDLLTAEPVPILDVDPDTTAVMMFTSGTAGAPRAAMLSHRNLMSNIEQSRSSPVHTEADDIVYGVLPLFHIFGLNVMLGVTLSAGATLLLVQRFDPLTAAESIVQRNVTVLPGAPPMWVAFAHFDEIPDDTFANVRIALSGASRLPVAVAKRCEERFGLRIAEGYGLTEASPVVTSSTTTSGPPKFGSVGRALNGVEIRIVAADGAPALVGDVGEVHVRGANVFQGYYRDPEVTSRVLDADGWLHTGDLATVDDDGWLYLVDRAKDLIIVSGFNVFPAEVEEVLAMHPAVAEVGVIGVPHPHTGEAVKAFVALAEGADVDEETLIDFAGDHLARYKCPSKVLFVAELPRNISGKLVRRHLDNTVLDNTVLDGTVLDDSAV
jgi:long-chain acyl-CoA synthetase